MDAIIQNPKDALTYVNGGKGKFTVVSKKTGTRFTFKASQRKTDGVKSPVFIKVLSGSDNQTDYRYIGFISTKKVGLIAGKKGLPTAVSFRALNWAVQQFAAGNMPEDLEFWHSGKCGCCGRELTVPDSIASGIGPVCAGRLQK